MSGKRDFIAEMDALIEAETQGSDWVPALVARKILAGADPVLVRGWLDAMAADVLTAVITRRERSARSLARSRAGSRAFASAVADAEDGDTSALGSFAVSFAVDEKNTRRRVADMTGKDHLFVAADYERDAQPLLLLAAFHQAVAKKVGRKTTADVFSEAEYDRLYRSIAKAEPKGAAA